MVTPQIAVMIEAKQKVAKVLDVMLKLQKKFGKSKKNIKAIKLMKKFLSCNLNCPTIQQKYNEIITLIGEQAGVITK